MGKNGKLSWNERLGYGLAAGISTDVPWAMLGYFLMYYYTDVFGIQCDHGRYHYAVCQVF